MIIYDIKLSNVDIYKRSGPAFKMTWPFLVHRTKFVAFLLKYKKYFFRIPTCSGQPGLTGKRLEFPRKIVLLFLFGFEADVLEIALQQQHDLVDKIFLVESTQSHRGVGNCSCSAYHLYRQHIYLDNKTFIVGEVKIYQSLQLSGEE